MEVTVKHIFGVGSICFAVISAVKIINAYSSWALLSLHNKFGNIADIVFNLLFMAYFLYSYRSSLQPSNDLSELDKLTDEELKDEQDRK